MIEKQKLQQTHQALYCSLYANYILIKLNKIISIITLLAF